MPCDTASVNPLVVRARCERQTPLGVPVVPLVYMISAMLSDDAAPAASGSCARRACTYAWDPSRTSGVDACNADATTSPLASSANAMTGSQSAITNDISPAVSRVLSGTTAAPRYAQAS